MPYYGYPLQLEANRMEKSFDCIAYKTEMNCKLESSSYFQSILPNIMDEVYKIFVFNEIMINKRLLSLDIMKNEDGFYQNTNRQITKAIEMMDNRPEEAAKLFYRNGSCYAIWEIKKRLLKEKHNIDWFTPAELNPHIIFD